MHFFRDNRPTVNGDLHRYLKGGLKMADHKFLYRGIVAGGVFGALAGVLLAPKSGKELRSDISEKGREVFGEGREFYFDTRKRAKKVLKEAKYQARKLRKEADQHLSDARRRAREIFA
jgi:gas vesicle protein